MNLGAQLLNAQTTLADPSAKYKFLDPGYWFDYMVYLGHSLYQIVLENFGDLWSILQGFAFFLTIFFISIIAYTAVRMLEIRAKEHKHLKHEIAEYAHHQAEKEKKRRESDEISRNPRWVKVIDYLLSANMNDWKLAVIEADSMLESLMDDLGFKGETLGDKLKSADRDKFRSLTAAWEVHNIRNRIAHEGSAFEMSLHEARRVIALYEQIFHEFGYI